MPKYAKLELLRKCNHKEYHIFDITDKLEEVYKQQINIPCTNCLINQLNSNQDIKNVSEEKSDLAASCYNSMFYGCTKLSPIIDIPENTEQPTNDDTLEVVSPAIPKCLNSNEETSKKAINKPSVNISTVDHSKLLDMDEFNKLDLVSFYNKSYELFNMNTMSSAVDWLRLFNHNTYSKYPYKVFDYRNINFVTDIYYRKLDEKFKDSLTSMVEEPTLDRTARIDALKSLSNKLPLVLCEPKTKPVSIDKNKYLLRFTQFGPDSRVINLAYTGTGIIYVHTCVASVNPKLCKITYELPKTTQLTNVLIEIPSELVINDRLLPVIDITGDLEYVTLDPYVTGGNLDKEIHVRKHQFGTCYKENHSEYKFGVFSNIQNIVYSIPNNKVVCTPSYRYMFAHSGISKIYKSGCWRSFNTPIVNFFNTLSPATMDVTGMFEGCNLNPDLGISISRYVFKESMFHHSNLTNIEITRLVM